MTDFFCLFCYDRPKPVVLFLIQFLHIAPVDTDSGNRTLFPYKKVHLTAKIYLKKGKMKFLDRPLLVLGNSTFLGFQ